MSSTARQLSLPQHRLPLAPIRQLPARQELPVAGFRRLSAAILLVQAVVLVLVIKRGWFYNDDFALLMNASHRSLGWNYLKSPINDHLLPGLRLEFWLLRHTSPLNFPLTIAVRVVLQLAGTALLTLLLQTLLGRRRRVLLATALYALCPLVLTNALWLTVALSLLPAQAFVLASIYAHVRFSATGRLRWACASGLFLLGGALFWEKVAVSAVLLPILSLGYLTEGNLRARLLSTVRQWRGWLLTALPIAIFTGYFIEAGYGGATKPVGVGDLSGVLWMQWSRVVAPSLFGGPWSWYEQPNVSLGFARISLLPLVLTQLAVLALVLLGIRSLGWRSLIGWAIPAVPLILGTSIVAFGRFAFFGQLISVTLRYGADLAVPLFLGAALAIVPTSAAEIRSRFQPVPVEASENPEEPQALAQPRQVPPAAGRRPLRLVGVLLAACWLAGSLLSVRHFDRYWGANPARGYVRTLHSNIADAGPTLNLYDSTVSQAVLPIFFGPRWHLSDFLPLMGDNPTLDAPATDPLLADDQGRLVPAALVPASAGTVLSPPPGGLCTYLVQGAGTFRIPLTTPAPEGDGFLRIDYLQQRPSTAEISIEDTSGLRKPVYGPAQVVFGYTLSHVTLRLPLSSVAAVIVHTGAPETHLCIGRLTVGAPFAVGGR